MRIDVHLHLEQTGNEFESRVLSLLSTIVERTLKMGTQLDDLKAAVAKNTEVIGSAITAIQGIKAKLDEAIASGDPAALTALSTELGTQDQALADAIAANTPAEPAPAP